MALITCPECGKQVSSLANSCLNCGAPIAELSKVKVHFHRAKKYTGSAISGIISVDGAPVGTASDGCVIDVMVSPGNHTFSTLSTNGVNATEGSGRGDNINVTIPENAKSMDVEIILKSPGIFFPSYLAFGSTDIKY